ncbi:hypothetical protein PMIN05_008825 [Paraphaeosphaeria minitans]
MNYRLLSRLPHNDILLLSYQLRIRSTICESWMERAFFSLLLVSDSGINQQRSAICARPQRSWSQRVCPIDRFSGKLIYAQYQVYRPRW